MDIFGLKAAKADDGVAMPVKDFDEEVIPGATITLLGMDSKKGRELQRKKQQAMLDRAVKGRNVQKLDAEKLAAESIDDMVQLTKAWTLSDSKGPMECTPENVRKVYSEVPHVFDQARNFVNDRANFT